MAQKDRPVSAVTIEQVNEYMSRLKPDTLVDVQIEEVENGLESLKKVLKTYKAVVLKVYPYVTRTSRGDFRNIDICRWNMR